MPYGENPTMKTVQAPASQASFPSLSAESSALKLRQGDHAMLARGDPGDDDVRVGISDFCIHVHA